MSQSLSAHSDTLTNNKKFLLGRLLAKFSWRENSLNLRVGHKLAQGLPKGNFNLYTEAIFTAESLIIRVFLE